MACTAEAILSLSIFSKVGGNEVKFRRAVDFGGIRSLDETRHLDQSETVKVARAVKQKYKKIGGFALKFDFKLDTQIEI